MRIKLNLLQLAPDRYPSIYWLHVDDNILLIRHLKAKIQKVLKESRDIELCLDNLPFLDEDDIHAIKENEEISVTVNERKTFIEPNSYQTNTKESNISINPSDSNSVEPMDFKSDNEHESTISTILPKSSKKRVRKRTHKKKRGESESALPTEKNGYLVTQPVSIITPPREPSKMHKRFKLENEEKNCLADGTSESSDDDCLQVTREVVLCNNEEKKNIQSDWRKEIPKTRKVPVFVRGQTSTVNKSIQNGTNTENENNKTSESNLSEDCDMLVVDWKNMSPMRVSNLSDLQVHDLIQFKTLSMGESGEPALSSVITARLEHIYKTTLHIFILSGMEKFMTVSEKFRTDEDLGTLVEVEYNDLFEIFKLV